MGGRVTGVPVKSTLVQSREREQTCVPGPPLEGPTKPAGKLAVLVTPDTVGVAEKAAGGGSVHRDAPALQAAGPSGVAMLELGSGSFCRVHVCPTPTPGLRDPRALRKQIPECGAAYLPLFTGWWVRKAPSGKGLLDCEHLEWLGAHP